MQHDGIAYIDTAMAHAGGIVGSLEKHKVARFDLRLSLIHIFTMAL